jgi:hypothetical protein
MVSTGRRSVARVDDVELHQPTDDRPGEDEEDGQADDRVDQPDDSRAHGRSLRDDTRRM